MEVRYIGITLANNRALVNYLNEHQITKENIIHIEFVNNEFLLIYNSNGSK